MENKDISQSETDLRSVMIARIETYFGCKGVWHEWDTKEIQRLNGFVVENFLRY